MRSPTNSCCFIIFKLKNSTRLVPFLKFAVFFLSKFPGFNNSIALVRTTFFVFCFLLRPIYIWFSGLKKSNIVRRQIEGRKGFLFPTSKKAETSTVTRGSLCYLFLTIKRGRPRNIPLLLFSPLHRQVTKLLNLHQSFKVFKYSNYYFFFSFAHVFSTSFLFIPNVYFQVKL